MARKLRVEYPGALYHVMNRGDRRELIFKDDSDRQRFLDALGEVCVMIQDNGGFNPLASYSYDAVGNLKT